MHSQHSVPSAPGSRMDGIAFCPFRNMNAELKNARISHSGHSYSRVVNKETRSKSLNDLAPFYLKELLSPYVPIRILRSSNKALVRVPRCNLKTYGERTFSYITPTLCNSLPEDMRTYKSLNNFESELKTFLFKWIFYCFLVQ